jgi:hypothetical protein
MPSIYRLTLAIAVAALAIGTAVAIAFPASAGLLSLCYLPLWLLWIACVFVTPTGSYFSRIIALWALIDAGLLPLVVGMARHVTAIYPTLGTDGSDVVILASYAPVVLPSGFFLPTSLRLGIPVALENSVGHVYANYLWAWVIMSCIAAVQSAVLIAIVVTIRGIRGRRSHSVGI